MPPGHSVVGGRPAKQAVFLLGRSALADEQDGPGSLVGQRTTTFLRERDACGAGESSVAPCSCQLSGSPIAPGSRPHLDASQSAAVSAGRVLPVEGAAASELGRRLAGYDRLFDGIGWGHLAAATQLSLAPLRDLP